MTEMLVALLLPVDLTECFRTKLSGT